MVRKEGYSSEEYMESDSSLSAEPTTITSASTKKPSRTRIARDGMDTSGAKPEILRKFDFDTPKYDIDPTKELYVNANGRRGQNSKKMSKSNSNHDIKRENNINASVEGATGSKKEEIMKLIEDRKNMIGSMALTIHETDLAKAEDTEGTTCKKDPLSDGLYTLFHKRMFRQETRMLDGDSNDAAREADRLQLLRDKLKMPNWEYTLRMNVELQNPKDEEELVKKRKIAIEHISEGLDNYNDVQVRYRILKQNLKRAKVVPHANFAKYYDRIEPSMMVDYSSSEDEEHESSLNANEIREYRRQRIEKKFGHRIEIGLVHKSVKLPTRVIVAEPLQKAYIIKSYGKEKKDWITNNSVIDKKLEYYKSLPDQTAKVLDRHIIAPNIPYEPEGSVEDSELTEMDQEENNRSSLGKVDILNGIDDESTIKSEMETERGTPFDSKTSLESDDEKPSIKVDTLLMNSDNKYDEGIKDKCEEIVSKNAYDGKPKKRYATLIPIESSFKAPKNGGEKSKQNGEQAEFRLSSRLIE